MAELQELTLENLKGGAAGALFQKELQKALENILDPNTPPKAKRTILLKVIISPEEDRERATITLQVSSSLPTHRPEAGIIYLGRMDGRAVAQGFDPKQRDFFRDEPDPKVTPIQKETASAH